MDLRMFFADILQTPATHTQKHNRSKIVVMNLKASGFEWYIPAQNDIDNGPFADQKKLTSSSNYL